jgi:hypothetical protein
MENSESRAGKPKSAAGDFYVLSDCCVTCGVPQVAAPDLVEWTNDPYPVCYWKKQPGTAQEIEQAITVFDAQEFNCHRYRGRDPEIQKRIGVENCDFPVIQPSIQSKVTNTLHFASVEPRGLLSRVWTKIFSKD